ERRRFEGVLRLFEKPEDLRRFGFERKKALRALDRLRVFALGQELPDARDPEVDAGLGLLQRRRPGWVGAVGRKRRGLVRLRGGGGVEVPQEEGGHADPLLRLLASGIDPEGLPPGL